MSGATALGSAAIDGNKISQQQSDVAELAVLKQQPVWQNPADQKREVELENAAKILNARAERWKAFPRTSRWSRFSSFFRDILSDGNGVEIHRLQNVLWTGFLGLVFLRAVWNSLALPDLDANLVLLMLVSSSTYLGMKQQSGK